MLMSFMTITVIVLVLQRHLHPLRENHQWGQQFDDLFDDVSVASV
jgi:hypothetical protein